jgi:hypothetical protein
VVIERAVFAYEEMWHRRIKRRYLPIAQRALEGDADATRTLVASPRRHRVAIATVLISALIDDRDPQQIAKTRSLVQHITARRVSASASRSTPNRCAAFKRLKTGRRCDRSDIGGADV